MIEINELEIQQFDEKYGTKSIPFPATNTIVVGTGYEDWLIKITNRKTKSVCLMHRNKYGRTNKFHIQTHKSCLLHAYQTIYNHRRLLPLVNTTNNTYIR